MAELSWIQHMKRADFNEIGRKYGIDPVVARVIRNRDVITDEEIDRYINGTLKDVHSPYLMKDMEKGALIMAEKIREGKSIRIMSDYDVDGVMSNYILLDGLKKAGADVSYDIPDRMKDGYGLNIRMIDDAIKDNIDTVITCDNGIAAVNAIEKAKENGMTVIVTDHHEVPEERVCADAVIDIKQPECNYPFKEICGATVAYKFIQVLYDKLGISLPEKKYIEMVGIATVCDVMSLTDENRIYVRESLKQMKVTENVGLKALLDATGLAEGIANGKELNAFNYGFVIGPCINATGRLESAKRGLMLLLEEDEEKAVRIAEELVEINNQRKELTAEGMENALSVIERDNLSENNVMVVYVPGLHESLAGIVAGRIREKFYKPAIVFTDSENDETVIKGSARSIDGYNMFVELGNAKKSLTQYLGISNSEDVDKLFKYGGHELAAGLSIKKDILPAFIRIVNAIETMTEDVLTPKLYIDVAMPTSYLRTDLIEQLEALGPFGKGNEKPVFAEAGFRVKSARVLGKNRNVIKFNLINNSGKIVEGIYFKPDEVEENIKEWFSQEDYDRMIKGLSNNICLDIAYQPDINEYMGERTIQIVIKHYRKCTR